MTVTKCLGLTILILGTLVLGACGNTAQHAQRPRTPQPTRRRPPIMAHWGYTRENGPARWGALDPSYATCANGQNQSPVDLANASQQDLADLAFHYQPTQVRILNNGHTVQVNYDPGSYIELDGQRYDLAQFHFHAPSEHAVNGTLYPAELHLVHKTAQGQTAVVAVFLEAGAENLAFKPVWDHLPAEESPKTAAGVEVNAIDLLPAMRTSYRYNGSLTTPPCTEGVTWIILTEPVTLSDAQIATFEQIFHGNNRPLQPLNGRQIAVESMR